MHTIAYNPEVGCLEVTVSGLWLPDGFDAFRQEMLRAIAAAGAQGCPPRSLYNFTAAAIQPQQVVEQMQAMAVNPLFAGRKAALYTEGCLARRQAMRVAQVSRTMRVFDRREAAIAWLMQDIAAA